MKEASGLKQLEKKTNTLGVFKLKGEGKKNRPVPRKERGSVRLTFPPLRRKTTREKPPKKRGKGKKTSNMGKGCGTRAQQWPRST